eukprot:TRINITY_DN9449_c0_g1_i1.p1 TRINITY_DN9449_c0_g1~~TRINITY_DN9449_c0_g1_i1.p1  ORF type:complete len:232 (-),score=43.38 TRINITY_DN9449_c0_g1_i1:685-1380(-)
MTESSRKGGLSTWKELCELYDAFIFDQFGVMHNGATSLPGAPELLSKLCKMGKQLVILSNSSKRAEWALAELPKLGIDSSAFIGAVTSGEEAWRALRRDWSGSKCVWLAKRDGSGVTGKETHQPGHLARFYEELGGQVLYYGKPEKEHFHACVRMLGLERQRIAHVGDSMHHDVTGALNAEIPVVFVAGGIEHKDLGISPGSTPNSDQLEALFLRYGAVPTHTVPLARWSE